MIQRGWPLCAALLLAGCLATEEAPAPEGAPTQDESGYVFDDPAEVALPAEATEPPADGLAEGAPAPEQARPDQAAPDKPDPNAAARLACTKRKGSFTRAATGAFFCVKPTRDGTKSCSSARDCQGACLARSGSCAPIAPLVGCHEILTNSGARSTVCVQ